MGKANSRSAGPETREIIIEQTTAPDDDLIWNPKDDTGDTAGNVKEDSSTGKSPSAKKAGEPAESTKSKKPKRERKVYVPDVPVAQTGFWGWLWRLVRRTYGRTGWNWLIVEPSVREWKAGIVADAERKQLRTLACNKKGGTGKTPVIVATGTIFAWVTQKATLLIDGNQTEGNTASRVGVKLTYSLRQTLKALKQLGVITHTWASHHFGHHPAPGYGSLMVMDSDDETQWDDDLSIVEVLSMFYELEEGFDGLFIDYGNTVGSAISRAGMRYAKVPMFVCRERLENSMSDCLKTITYYRRTMLSMVTNGVVVVVGWRKGDSSLEDYAETFGISKKRIILIPDDPFYEAPKVKNAKPSDDLIKVFTAEQLRRRTLKAYFRLIRLLFELTPEYTDHAEGSEKDASKTIETDAAIYDPDADFDLLDLLNEPSVSTMSPVS